MEVESPGGISEFDYETQSVISNKDDDGKYVLFAIERTIGSKTYGFRIFFNNQKHITVGENRSSMTNSQLAEMFLDYKWASWRRTTIDPAIERIKDDAFKKVDVFISDEAKKLREEYRRHGTIYRQKMGVKNKRIKLSPEEAAVKGKIFKTITVIARKTKRGNKLRSNSEILYEEMTSKQKMEFNEMRKQDWYKNIQPKAIEYEEEGNIILAQMAINPFVHGMFVKNIFQRAAQRARFLAVTFMLGLKSPDITPKTKRNRRWRGNPDRPALNETGELANSIEYEVY